MANETHPLNEYLDRSGRTLTEVADAAQCSRMTLYRLMKGEQNATIDLLKRISAATGGEVGISAFLGTEAAQ
ncbi:helix-turn-helix domain-containing protein [Rhizobium rhizogenes]|uniref:helix-turn-helix domain-containing protein n=1 Tax=Rhizobium rhizogenes TaxID=359 RepID=UPI001571925F|nr:helix-turn-helix domain-containing protein [Rhizobium rhizogenes]NTG07206.1 helix-turn-helix transcriptional regulator [Rhizobium rhizogenes]